MSSFKLFALLVVASTLSNQLVLAAESDWEVLNMALDNINAANPTVLKNSIGNILLSFLPPADTTTTAAPALPSPSSPQQPNVIVVNSPATPAPSPVVVPAPSSQMSPATLQQLLLLYPQLFSRPSTQPAPQPNQQVITQILDSNSHENCECKKKPKSLAEFLVNVPCPTTTQKPPKKIIVKVPCPTTTTTTEKPCQCQCCPCNPCPSKSEKKHKSRKPCSSEESHETVYKTYQIANKHELRRPRPYFTHSEHSDEQ